VIKHIVLFKVREGVSREDPRLGRAFATLRALPGRIEGVQWWEVGENFSDRPVAVDYSLFSAFWQVCDYVTG
jgi:hypothetical protein